MRVHERTFRTQSAPGGVRSYLSLPWVPECMINRLAVLQVGGTLGAFRVNLYNAEIAVRTSQSSGGADEDGEYTGDPESYRVAETMDSETVGRLTKIFDPPCAFVNQDGSGPTNRGRRIYVELEPEGSGDKTFDITITCTRD